MQNDYTRDRAILQLQTDLNQAYYAPNAPNAIRAAARLRQLLPTEVNLGGRLVAAPCISTRQYKYRVNWEVDKANWDQWLAENGRAPDEIPMWRWLVEERASEEFRRAWNQQYIYGDNMAGHALPALGLRPLLNDRAVADLGDIDHTATEEYISRTLGIIKTNYHHQANVIVVLSEQLLGTYQAVHTLPISRLPNLSILPLKSMYDSRRIWCTPPSNLLVSACFPEEGWFGCEVDSKGLYLTLDMGRYYQFADPRQVSSTKSPE